MRIFKIALLVVFAASTLLGTAGSASASTTVGCTSSGFRDDRPSNGFFSYSPDWTNLSNYGHSGGEPKERTTSFTYTLGVVHRGPWGTVFEDQGVVMFDITCRNSFDFFYAKAPNRGIVDIYALATPGNAGWSYLESQAVDQYASEVQWQRSSKINLPPGTRRVALVNSGRKNPASNGFSIDLDGITPR